MIITVPANKRIYYNRKQTLNESVFDDDLFDDDLFDDNLDDKLVNPAEIEYLELYDKPRIQKLLDQFEITNYEIKCLGQAGIVVDVHDNLYLSNKKLDKINLTAMFRFGVVYGNCNFTGNNLSDWKLFPEIIKGNCYANFNNIKNFNGVPTVYGKLIASKQNKRSEYPLTDENYQKYRAGLLKENEVYVIPVNRFGLVYSICENDNSCIIKFKDNTRQKFKLNDVDYIGNLENLFM